MKARIRFADGTELVDEVHEHRSVVQVRKPDTAPSVLATGGVDSAEHVLCRLKGIVAGELVYEEIG